MSDSCHRGPDPAFQSRRDTVAAKFGVRLTLDQKKIVETYLARGSVRAAFHKRRGMGKTFALAYIAALELGDGNRVVLRQGVGSNPHYNPLRDALAGILGEAAVRDAWSHGRLVLAGAVPHQHARGMRDFVDVHDEPWAGGCAGPLPGAIRWAAVGGLPEDTLTNADFSPLPWNFGLPPSAATHTTPGGKTYLMLDGSVRAGLGHSAARVPAPAAPPDAPDDCVPDAVVGPGPGCRP